MLNPFPELLNYSLLAPFFIRVVLGLIFIDLGVLKFRGERARWEKVFNTFRLRPASFFVSLYGLLQVVGGILLLIGLYTQVAALAFVIFTAIEFYLEWTEGAILKRDLTFYLLILVMAVSLLLTGAGAYAFDIPL